jgi:hypothetical protein
VQIKIKKTGEKTENTKASCIEFSQNCLQNLARKLKNRIDIKPSEFYNYYPTPYTPHPNIFKELSIYNTLYIYTLRDKQENLTR